MNLIKQLQEARINETFKEYDTGMPYYNTFLTKTQTAGYQDGAEYMVKAKGKMSDIIYIEPLDYLRATVLGFEATGQTGDDSIKELDELTDYMRSTDNFAEVYEKMKSGTKFFMPVLEYEGDPIGFTQEGRNRALAAHDLNEKEIPVLVVYPYKVQDRLMVAKFIPHVISEKLSIF